MPSIVNMFVKDALDNKSSCPTLDPKRCLNSKQGKARCSACVEICPGGALLIPEKGKASIDMDRIDGMTGVCSITTGTSAKGNEFNNVGMFYPPSKAPRVTANDAAWDKRDGFMDAVDDPFNDLPEA